MPGGPNRVSKRAGSSAKPRATRSGARSTAVRRTTRATADATPELRHISVSAIRAPRRPARRFLGDIPALAESMQEYGLQQPISVRLEGNRYLLTSGMRRLEAAKLLGWPTILAFVRQVSADDAYLLDLIENLQRENLSPEEEADAFGELVRTRGWTLQQVADGVKRSVGYVSKRVRIFDDPTLRKAVVEGGLPVSTAEELLASRPELRERLIAQAIAEGWDQVRAREALRLATLVETPSATETTRGSRPQPSPTPTTLNRPRGFTRAIREFHQHILSVRAEDLTAADRAALRSLFRDLVMLARAATSPRARVFPDLPTTPRPKRPGRS